MVYGFACLLEPELVDQYESGSDRCQKNEAFREYIQDAFHVRPVHPACELYMFYVHFQV